jgi:hypothetical protein
MGVKRNVKVWSQSMENLRSAQKLLERQRYQFPSDWRHFDQIEGEWEAFTQIMDRRARILDRELPNLKNALLQKDRVLEENITMLYAEWSAQKPVQGNIKPANAMEVIKVFDERLQKLREEFEQVSAYHTRSRPQKGLGTLTLVCKWCIVCLKPYVSYHSCVFIQVHAQAQGPGKVYTVSVSSRALYKGTVCAHKQLMQLDFWGSISFQDTPR